MNTSTTSLTTSPRHLDSLRQELLDGGIAALVARLADDVVLDVPGRQPLSGRYVGREAVLRFVADTRARTDHGERIEILDALVGTDHIALSCHVTAERGDRTLDNLSVHLLRVVDGEVVEIRLHNFDDHTVTEFWS